MATERGLGAENGLGEAMRARRHELGLTQESLAHRIGHGVRQADVSRLERGGVTLPRRERLFAIAEALGLAPSDLLARSGWGRSDADREHRPGGMSALGAAGPHFVDLPPTTATGDEFGTPDPPLRGPALDAESRARMADALERAQATRARSSANLRDARRACARAAEVVGEATARQGVAEGSPGVRRPGAAPPG